MNTNTATRLLAFLSTALLTSSASAAFINIDTFGDGAIAPFSFVDTTADSVEVVTTQTGLSTSDVIGGGRQAALNLQGGNGITMDINTVAGNSNLGSNPGDVGDFSFRYGDYVPGIGALNTDMTDGGLNDSFRIIILNADFTANVFFTIRSNGMTETQMQSVPSGPSTIELVFTGYSTSFLQDVDGIDIRFDGSANFDATINFIGAVPEPASLAMLAIGGVTLLRRRRAA